MIKLLFKKLKRQYPDEAKEFMAEQEMLALFLNSSKRLQILKSLKLSAAKKKNIEGIIDSYALCKIRAEKKMKSRARKDIIKVENKCLKKFFEGHILKVKVKGGKKKALTIAKNLISKKFPDATILDEVKMAALARKVGMKKKFPTDFLVFDRKKKKIVSFGVVTK